jgi:hypothetical protein
MGVVLSCVIAVIVVTPVVITRHTEGSKVRIYQFGFLHGINL